MKKALFLIINILLITEIVFCLQIRQKGAGTANYLKMLEEPGDTYPEKTGEKMKVLNSRRIYVITIDKKPQSSSGSSHKPSSPSGGSSSGGQSEPAEQKTPYFSDARGMLGMINTERQKNGMNALSWDEELYQACKIRCPELQQKFSHTRPNGLPGKSAYPKYRSYPTGENISVIGYWDTNALKNFYNGFCGSSNHYFNMIQQPYTHVGIAIYYADNGKVYCCMLLTEKN
ncbi:MAG: CAP domain-containing protein [Erysipelotrichaceae bacterium]|nr:CAP domain-containing protein [Erysipelotrichaceae bacterium]